MEDPIEFEFRVKWQACPRIHNPSRVLFVVAGSKEDAEAVAKDHIERTAGISWFVIDEVTVYVKPTGGRVLGGTV